MFKLVVVAGLFAVVSAFPAAANDVIDIQSSPAQIRGVQKAIRLAVEHGEGAYKDLNSLERQSILDQQQVVYRLLDGKDSIDLLNEPQKVELANALESINAQVSKAEDERKVCERVKVVGSNRPQNVCMTVGQRRRLQEATRREGTRTTN